VAAVVAPTDRQGQASPVTTERVWRELGKASFAIVSYVTPEGEPRSSGVVYTIIGRRMYVAVAPDSWKAHHMALNGHVSVTVPIRRGGLLSLVAPIPPAVISFHGKAIVHPNGWEQMRWQLNKLEALLPLERRAAASIIEIVPEGRFLTYGVGVSLMQMRTPSEASGHAGVS
jgi:hypothetical protein